MSLKALLFLSLICLGLQGCKPASTTPSAYDKDGVKLTLPAGWKVSQDSNAAANRYLVIDTPGNAVMTINVLDAAIAPPLKQFVDSYIEVAIKETPVFTRTKGTIAPLDIELNGSTIHALRNEFAMEVAGASVPFKQDFYPMAGGSRIAYLATLASNDEEASVKGGFEQVLSTFSLR
ncbi:hypothetical protein [Chitinimonas sp.]|uniref:hypothetical protein n=1 Tax=Chitinimonas sp. TaxID=1934313 RepID=UPI0035AE5A60